MQIRNMTVRQLCRKPIVAFSLSRPRFFLFVMISATAAFCLFLFNAPSRADLPGLPTDYGEVIYRYNADSAKQLYIIGISHRNALDRRFAGENVIVRTQAETYRIGEWLYRNANLELLLPEGFFKAKASGRHSRSGKQMQLISGRQKTVRDNAIIEQRLTEDSCFVNAEMLLLEDYLMKARQVEDRRLYESVVEGLKKLTQCKEGYSDFVSLHTELQYLQKLRTAEMLQNIPGIVESEFQNGNIRKKVALFTIGLNHINGIIQFLENNKILIKAPGNTGGVHHAGDYSSETNLVKQAFGVTIILPRTLADNPRILQQNNLDDFMSQGRG